MGVAFLWPFLFKEQNLLRAALTITYGHHLTNMTVVTLTAEDRQWHPTNTIVA